MLFEQGIDFATRRLTGLLLCAFVLIGASSAAAAPRLCMLPSILPFDEDDVRRSILEARVSEHFERDGIEIAGSKDFGKLAEEVDERSGAIFDPATGRVVEAAREIYEKDLEQSTRERFGCSGFVRLIVSQVLAQYGGAAANWDGRRVMINSGPRLALQVLAGVSEYGWVPALSLWIHVTDLKREDVAFRTAGIEPLQDLSLSRGQDLLPEDRWLRDPDHVDEALDVALGEGISKLKQAGRPKGAGMRAEFRWD